MSFEISNKKKGIGKILFFYLGSAWVFIEAFSFVIERYHFESYYLDVIILIVLFGLPSMLIYHWHNTKFTFTAISLQVFNWAIAISVISFGIANQDVLKPRNLSILSFKKNQKEIASNIRSMVILPFNNLTGDSTKQILALGLHDELVGKMGMLSSVKITPTTSALVAASASESILDITSKLMVDAAVESSLLPSDKDHYKIQLKLIGTIPEEQVLWSETFFIKKEKILELYGDIAISMAKKLNLALAPKEDDRLSSNRVVNPQAYELYIKGQHQLSFLTMESVNEAEKLFLKSIELDSINPESYAGLAGVWIARKQVLHYSPEETDPKMDYYINKSFEYDSANYENWRWYASKLMYEYKWEKGLWALEKCSELNPNFGEVHAFKSHAYMVLNNWEEAWKEIEIAREKDPLNPLIKFFIGPMYLFSGQYEQFLGTENNETQSMVRFEVYSHLNQFDTALMNLKIGLKQASLEEEVILIDNIYDGTNFNEVLKLIGDSLTKKSDKQYVFGTLIANIYKIAGDVDSTVEWIERMYIRKDPNLMYWAIQGDRIPKWLREHPRYITVMKRINLYNF